MPVTHRRTCHICEANCGVIVTAEGRDILSIKGDPDNAMSRGHVCPKATAIADLQKDPDRLRRPMKRMGDPIERVGPVVFLASRLASYVTGAVLPVDGGLLAR